MSNIRSGDSYIGNYSFQVQLGLFVKLSFQKITNIETEIEIETLGDGGNNERMYFFEKPKRKPDRIVFHRGVVSGLKGNVVSYLSEGVKVNDIMILVKRGSSIKKIFYIEQGIISKISYSDLDALNGQILITSMEMQHTGIAEIPV